MRLSRPRWRGLRARTLLVFGLAFLPIAGLAAYLLVQASGRERSIGSRQADRWARLLSVNQQQLVATSRLVLTSFARSGAQMPDPACAEQARHYVGLFPQAINLGVADLAGEVHCSAVAAGRVNVRDRDYFRRALAEGRFVYGGLVLGRITNRPTLNFGLPVVDAAQETRGVAFLALDLGWLSEWASNAVLPEGAVLTLIDEEGRIVYRNQETERWVGRPFEAPELEPVLASRDSGTVVAVGLDGVRRMYHFVTIPDSAGLGKMRVLAGIPESEVLALTYRIRGRAILTLLLALLVVLAIGWMLTDRLLLRRIDRLRAATLSIAAGNLSTRVREQRGSDEISELASSFDEMAAALEAQHARIARDEANERFLAEASRVLSASLNYQHTLQQITKLAVPHLADLCILDVRPAEDDRGFHAVQQSGACMPDGAQPWQACHPENGKDSEALTTRVLETGQSILIPRLMVVPLQHASETVGTVTLIGAESRDAFDEIDLALTKEVARRAAIAVQNARLYERVRTLNTELEDRVQRRTSELEVVNRELEAFSYSVSHDLRSPLRSIDGFSQALAEDYADTLDATGRDYLQRIRAAAQRMGQLIDDMLSLARISRQDMRRTPVDLSTLAQNIVRDLVQTDPQREATIVIQPELRTVADRGLMRIVLDNLLRNAWKFTRRKPVTQIEFGRQDIAGEEVFYVRDNGAGFDMEYAGKLFGPFQRLHGMSEFEGTGIGLATVQRIVSRHGGRIWADAAVNRGATFYFTIPER